MIDRSFISTISKVKKITIKISIRKLKSKIYYSNKYVILIFYIKSILFNDIRTFAQITREIYIVNNLKTNMLIELDIFTLKRIIINFIT